MKQKILKILGYAFDPEIAEMKAEEIIRLFNPVEEKYEIEYELTECGGKISKLIVKAKTENEAIEKFTNSNPEKEWLTIKKL